MTDSSAPTRWDQRLFAILWTWIAFRTALPWLVFFRLTFEGSGYSWGTSYFGRTFHSSGLARLDFLVVYALLAVSLLIFWRLRLHDFRLGRPLALLYLAFFAADALWALRSGDPIIFQGDTLGVTLNVTILFFVLNIGLLAVGLAWWWGARDVSRGAGPRPMTPARRNVVRACIGFVPVQLALLIFGEPHELTDEIGVIGTLLQWVLLAWAFYPGSRYR